MEWDLDIAIIGGGAAGLAAGVFAGQQAAGRSLRIAILDGASSLGAKILVSGGGRCNVTHDRVIPDDFNGPRTIIRNILRAFDEKKAADWFSALGVQLKLEETGKLFPVTDKARTVLDALVRRCTDLGVRILTGRRVEGLRRLEPEGFELTTPQQKLTARRVIFCTGGLSLPKTGSDGAGYAMVKALGHTVTQTWPALVPLTLEASFFHAELSGLSQEVELRVFVDGKQADRRRGQLLWTHFGISGPVVMDASRFWTQAKGMGAKVELRCSLMPELTFEELDQRLVTAAENIPKREVFLMLADKLPRRLAEQLCRFQKIGRYRAIGQLTRENRRKLAHALTEMELPVAGARGWNYAEVTAGGVPLEEIDFRTMESRKCPGLYLAGEILDCEGRIGGFNFQWAWATGHLAGRAAAG